MQTHRTPMTRSVSTLWQGFLTLALTLAVLAGAAYAPPAAAQASTSGCPDQQEVALHYSLYYENYKNENDRDALSDLHWILENCPGFPRDKDKNFERAVEIYERLAGKADDPAQKRAYLDSVLVMYERAVPVLRAAGAEVDEFEWTLKKGRFIQNNVDDLDDRKGDAIEAYRKAYELDPAQLDPYYLDVILAAYYTDGDIGGALDFLRGLNETRGEEEGIKALITKYFSVIPPEEQITFLEGQLAEDPGNVETLNQLYRLYDRQGMEDKRIETMAMIVEADPSNTSMTRRLIGEYLQSDNFDEAEALFEQLRSTPGFEMAAEDYLNMGYAQLGAENYSEAMRFYRQALDANSDFTPARQAIADLYATLVSKCGIGDRKQKGVFWLVADAYQRAGDSAGAARYRAVFPSEEDVFFFNEWNKGATVSVSYGCRGVSISGSTTVRTSN